MSEAAAGCWPHTEHSFCRPYECGNDRGLPYAQRNFRFTPIVGLVREQSNSITTYSGPQRTTQLATGQRHVSGELSYVVPCLKKAA
eukprot:scaffold970_cov412-Prasinococcus_capsulatus_cf.AAC.8